MGSYARPDDVATALAALAAGSWVILAGGTDYFPARVAEQPDENVLDITGLADLAGIAPVPGGWRIGALARWSDLIAAPLPPAFDGFKQAARQIGAWQVQNTGTIIGNLCNASPAADGVPWMLALDAQVELASRTGNRTLDVRDFVLGNRRTARRPDELVTGLFIPEPPSARSLFMKLGGRHSLVISIVMLAALLEVQGERVVSARLAVGACSPVALRLTQLEQDLIGQPLTTLAELVRPDHLAALSPIDDVRATAAYRRDTALTLVRRALMELSEVQP